MSASYLIDVMRTPRGRDEPGMSAWVTPRARIRAMATVGDELERTGKQTAVSALCICGGTGIAALIERV